MQALATILALIPFYLLGAFPTGVLLARIYRIDITSEGSGNVGATNVARVLGKRAGIVALVVDIAKGFLACALAALIFTNLRMPALAGVAAVAGHCFSIPGKLKGGKGVATALGTFFYLSFFATLISLGFFAAIFRWKRIVSLASISAALIAPVAAMLLNVPGESVFGMAATAVLVVARHRQNIVRLIEGTEQPFKSKAAAA